jgi:glycosidase
MIALLQMTYVGAPMIYYGTEAGMWGAHDPDDRMPMVWADLKHEPQTLDPREGRERQPDEIKFDDQLFGFYKSVIALRKEHPALAHGEYAVLATDDVQRAFVFTRRSPKRRCSSRSIAAISRPQSICIWPRAALNRCSSRKARSRM